MHRSPEHRIPSASYCVVPGSLYAGEYPGSRERGKARAKVDALLSAGISLFIDLTEEWELIPYDELLGHRARHVRHPVPDGGVPSQAEMRCALDELGAFLDSGRIAYVHCWGGHGRTGTMIACYLIEAGASPNEALLRLRALREGMEDGDRASPETLVQHAFVRSWNPR